LEYPKVFAKILLILERFLAKRSNSIIAVSQGIAEEMSKRLNISKPIVIRNLPEHESLKTSNLSNPLRRAINLDLDTPIILFQGGINPGRGLMLLIDAMPKIKNTKTTLVFLGNGSLIEKLREKANSSSLKDRVFFYPAVSSKILPYWTADATIGVHPIEGICLNHLLALPNKIFEYIQANIPVLVSNLPEMKKIIDHYQVGLTFKDGDVNDLALQIDYLIDNPKLLNRYKFAAKIAAKELTWEIEKKKLIKLYKLNFTKAAVL
jgi:glycosyltransferase involved in cell wall biosynthesis